VGRFGVHEGLERYMHGCTASFAFCELPETWHGVQATSLMAWHMIFFLIGMEHDTEDTMTPA
jgi:hypothetical protein